MSNYGFKCPTEGCKNRAQLYFLMPMRQRPKCLLHDCHYVPDINWPPGVKIEDAIIEPEEAQQLLDDCFESSLDGVNEALVSQYTELMASGKWKGVTVEMGGEHYPIYLRDDRVLLGIQRLLACVRSNTPFQTVIVRTYGYY